MFLFFNCFLMENYISYIIILRGMGKSVNQDEPSSFLNPFADFSRVSGDRPH